jgi:orotate phosphoribosyltransferase
VLRAAADIRLAGLIVSVDRQERGLDRRSALSAVADEFAMPTFAIVTLDDIVEHLAGREVNGKVVLTAELLERIAAYRDQYGAI